MRFLPPNEIERLRREAKKISRTQEITHSAALDHIAIELGFQNWSMLKKFHSAPQVIHPIFSRTADEMRESFRKISDPMTSQIENNIRDGIPDLSSEFANPMSALRYAESYVSTALSLSRYSPSRFSIACIEMRVYLPYTLHPLKDEEDTFIILGRDYKPLGMPQRKEHVKYEKFKNLHVHIQRGELENATRHDQYSTGYLYSVGPHTSRSYANTYFKQLRVITDLVERYTKL